MSKDYMKIELGGVERGLKFNMGTFRFIGELTGKDPLRFSDSATDVGELFRIVRVVIQAAMLSNCLSKGVEPDFTTELVERWVSELQPQQGTEVLNAFTDANTVAVTSESDKKKQAIKN